MVAFVSDPASGRDRQVESLDYPDRRMGYIISRTVRAAFEEACQVGAVNLMKRLFRCEPFDPRGQMESLRLVQRAVSGRFLFSTSGLLVDPHNLLLIPAAGVHGAYRRRARWIGFRCWWVLSARSTTATGDLGAGSSVILAVAVISTIIGDLNHANLNLTWGPARFLVNSPRMHFWHHALRWPASQPYGVNFGIVLSAWDWLFGTAYWPSPHEAPDLQPYYFGFQGMAEYPRSLLGAFSTRSPGSGNKECESPTVPPLPTRVGGRM
jgi:hypothetical protein